MGGRADCAAFGSLNFGDWCQIRRVKRLQCSNKVGHSVTVYERADGVGGLLMHGFPNTKLDKGIVDRRIDLMRQEGVLFVTDADIGDGGNGTWLVTQMLDDGNGRVKSLTAAEYDERFQKVDGTERSYDADLVLLAMGFRSPEHYVSEPLGLELDQRSNYQAEKGVYRTSNPKVFAAGDCRSGQSLVVRAINEGREAAREIDRFLSGTTGLP